MRTIPDLSHQRTGRARGLHRGGDRRINVPAGTRICAHFRPGSGRKNGPGLRSYARTRWSTHRQRLSTRSPPAASLRLCTTNPPRGVTAAWTPWGRKHASTATYPAGFDERLLRLGPFTGPMRDGRSRLWRSCSTNIRTWRNHRKNGCLARSSRSRASTSASFLSDLAPLTRRTPREVRRFSN
jgi:hypothetical protein